MLYVDKSQLPRAGKGLFTDEFIKKGTLIIEYLGEIIPWSLAEKRAADGKGGYVFWINNNHCIDAYATPKHLARYANDARGLARKKGLRNNSVYDIRKKRGYIQATRNIQPGEEIFVWYGPDYWEEHKQEMIDFKLKKRAEARKKAANAKKKAATKTKVKAKTKTSVKAKAKKKK